MRVKILPTTFCGKDGVSTYAAELGDALRSRVEITEGADYDILHLVEAHRYDSEWREAKKAGKKLVVTVHDLIPEIFKMEGEQYAGVKERAEILSAADCIVAVSEHTKKDIVRLYGIAAEKIRVVHNGVACEPVTESKKDEKPYLLWVGRRAGYKNFFWFVKATAGLLRKRQLRVICTGGQAFGRKERLWLFLHGVYHRYSVVGVSKIEMRKLYAQAEAMVMPSRYEGFGLPLIEAMACGCPAVVPKEHVFPEIAGEAAFWYNPQEAKSLRMAIAQAIEAGAGAEKIALGRERAAEFSWTKAAEQVVRIYKELV